MFNTNTNNRSTPPEAPISVFFPEETQLQRGMQRAATRTYTEIQSGVRAHMTRLQARGQAHSPEYTLQANRLSGTTHELFNTAMQTGIMPGHIHEIRPRAVVSHPSLSNSTKGEDSVINGGYKPSIDVLGNNIESHGTATSLTVSKSDLDALGAAAFPKALLLTLATAQGAYVGLEVSNVYTNYGGATIILSRMSTTEPGKQRTVSLHIPFNTSESGKKYITIVPGVSVFGLSVNNGSQSTKAQIIKYIPKEGTGEIRKNTGSWVQRIFGATVSSRLQ